MGVLGAGHLDPDLMIDPPPPPPLFFFSFNLYSGNTIQLQRLLFIFGLIKSKERKNTSFACTNPLLDHSPLVE